MKRLLILAAYTIGLIAMLSSGNAVAQLDQGISTQDLVDPWDRAREILLSLTQSLGSFGEQDRRRFERELNVLDDELLQLQSHEETVAIRIASNPGFAFDVSVSSDQMSKQVSEIGMRLGLLLCDLRVCRRADVLAMQESLDALRQSLSDKNRLERDVFRALGSGGKNEIQALAVRWWAGSESVGRLREAVATMRREVVLLRPFRDGNDGRLSMTRSDNVSMSRIFLLTKRESSYATRLVSRSHGAEGPA